MPLIAVPTLALVLLGPALTGQRREAFTALRHLVIASLGAIVLNLPWLIEILRNGDAASLLGLWVGRSPVPSAAQMLTGSIGGLRTGLLGWGLVLAAAVPLLTGRRWRLGWAVGGWLAVAAGLAVAALAGSSDLIAGAGVEVFLVPVALGLALAVCMLPLAFEDDVVRSDFGTPQIASFLGAVALVLALVPQTLAATQGRWYLPAGDFDRALNLVDDGDDFRALWIGDADVLPLAGWSLESVPGVNLGFSEGLDPTMSLRWRLDGGDSVEATSEALTAALEGRTARLGRGISPMAIRYVVVVDRPAPEPFAASEVGMPAGVVDALEEQLDLTRVLVGPGIDLFEVSAAWPPRSDITETPAPGETPEAVLGDGFGTEFSGELPDGSTIAQAVTADPGWRLDVDGEEAPSDTLFAWGQKFAVDSGGEATLAFSPPLTRRVEQLWQVLALVGLVALASRRTTVAAPRRRRRVIATEEPLLVLEGPGESPEDWSPGDLAAGDPATGDPDQLDSIRSDDARPDSTGPDATGPEVTGPDGTGPDAAGAGAAGTDATGSDVTGPDVPDADDTGRDDASSALRTVSHEPLGARVVGVVSLAAVVATVVVFDGRDRGGSFERPGAPVTRFCGRVEREDPGTAPHATSASTPRSPTLSSSRRSVTMPRWFISTASTIRRRWRVSTHGRTGSDNCGRRGGEPRLGRSERHGGVGWTGGRGAPDQFGLGADQVPCSTFSSRCLVLPDRGHHPRRHCTAEPVQPVPR